MPPIRSILCILVSCTLPTWAQAEVVVREGDPVSAQQQPRFFPIDTARRGNPAGVRTSYKKQSKRSDSAAMENGFFRIDRTHLTPSRGPLVIRVPQDGESAPANGEPKVIYGGSALQPAAQESAALGQDKLFPLPAFKSQPLRATSSISADSSSSILSLFAGDITPQHSSFRDALRASGVDSRTPVTMKHQWPVPMDSKQRLSSQYGFRNDPFRGDPKFHSGIDIAAPIGTPVVASADGVVIGAAAQGGYGQTITIQHADGSESRYSHLSSQAVKQGQNVKAGQTIGAVGSSGHSTGAHLDYRLTKEGVSVNPFEAITHAKANATPAPQKTADAVAPRSRTARSERIIVVQ